MHSKLFLKTFLSIVGAVLIFTAAGYFSFVPWVRDTVQQQEERTGRLVLNNIYEMAKNEHRHLEAWRESAMQARRRELRHIVQVAIDTIDRFEKHARQQGLSPEDTRERILSAVRDLTYGQQDYLFITDYSSRLLSHPDPKLHGADYSEVRDSRGNLIVPPIVAGARENDEGFHRYWWRRLGEEEPSAKLTYYKHLPEREWVIASGVYIDDVEEEIQARKEAMIERLRRHLDNTRIAETGYVYIFDADMNMIIHPNPNIEGTNFRDLKNPVSDNPIGQELIQAAETQENKLVYKWDKPSDPGNYAYDKIAWVRHLEELDWYIASSVYLSEFRNTANALTWRIAIVGLVALVIMVLGASLFLRRLTNPISRLAESASRVGQGDLTVKTDIRRDDEIGVLAATFNAMVDRLKGQIDHMESRVAERTEALNQSVQDLERRNQESAEINQMGELLQSCRGEEEVFTVAARTCKSLFPEDNGRIYMLDEGQGLRLAAEWGGGEPITAMADSQACWAVRRGVPHQDPIGCRETLCGSCCEADTASLCVPLLAEGSVTGVIKLNLAVPADQVEEATARRQPLLTTVAEQVAMSVTNIRLQQRLHRQSIQDPLTGLYNRRQLEETLPQEISRASRHGDQVGVVMLDIDHFKWFNDTYGHELGDTVLQEVGKVLRRNLRTEDSAFRYGGEEFTLVLPETDAAGVAQLAELIRGRIEEQVAASLGRELGTLVTISLGWRIFPSDGDTPDSLLQAADWALYQAKLNGRNQIWHGVE